MRTLLIIALGLIISTVLFYLFPKKNLFITGIAFSLGWLAVTVWNLQIGLSHGYSLAEEAPIHVLLYLVPVSVFWIVYFYLKH